MYRSTCPITKRSLENCTCLSVDPSRSIHYVPLSSSNVSENCVALVDSDSDANLMGFSIAKELDLDFFPLSKP